MAVETNRKRPWEEDDTNGDSACSGQPSYSARSSISNQLETPPWQECETHTADGKELSQVSKGNSIVLIPSSSNRRVDIVSSNCGTPSCRHSPQPPLVGTGYKRQRDERCQIAVDYQPKTIIPCSNANSLGLRLQGTAPSLYHPLASGKKQAHLFRVSPSYIRHNPGINQKIVPSPDNHSSVTVGAGSLYSGRLDSGYSTEGASISSCRLCSNLGGLAQRVDEGLEKLYGEMTSLLTSNLVDPLAFPDLHALHKRSLVSSRGLPQLLERALERLEASIHIVYELKKSSARLPQIADQTKVLDDKGFPAADAIDELRGQWGRSEASSIQPPQKYSPPPGDDEAQMSGRVTRPITSEDDRGRSLGKDFVVQTTSSPTQKHYPPPASALVSLQSPIHAPTSSRHLPSPSSLSFPSPAHALPPLSPSMLSSKSAHIAYLQELQHQLSTKSLALQILQGEHDKLLSAFSRSQTRCATLDKKSQVADTEINGLTEDRIRLLAQVEAYELQLDELQQSRDEAHRQSAASGAQYMQIMAMSSKLQVQGAADAKKWRADRETWQQEIGNLEVKISSLERKLENSPCHADDMTLPNIPVTLSLHHESSITQEHTLSYATSADILSSTSIHELRDEIKRLWTRLKETEFLLQAWQTESVQVDVVVNELRSMSERMHNRSLALLFTEKQPVNRKTNIAPLDNDL